MRVSLQAKRIWLMIRHAAALLMGCSVPRRDGHATSMINANAVGDFLADAFQRQNLRCRKDT